MKTLSNKSLENLLALALCTVIAAGCAKKEDPAQSEQDFELSEYKVFVRNTSDTKLTTSGKWEDNDVITIALNGDDAQSFKLVYSSADDCFSISAIGTSSTITSTNVISALYAKESLMEYDDGLIYGIVNGDVIWTQTGSVVVDNNAHTIDMTLALNIRPISLVKITNAGGSCRVTSAVRTFTEITSLASMDWSVGNEPSFVYNTSEDAVYCYGIFPASGVIDLQYTTADKKVYTRTVPAIGAMRPGQMYTLGGPAGPEKAQWTEKVPDYNHTGTVYTYYKGGKAKPNTLVVTGDGFTAYDHKVSGSKFYDCAKKSIDYIFDVEPYKTYKEYFNIYFICAVSNERGNSTSSVTKDTYFSTKWNNGDYSSMVSLSTASRIRDLVKNYCPDVKNGSISYSDVKVLCLCNTDMYGGLCYYDASPAFCFATGCLSGNTLAWASWGTPEKIGRNQVSPGYLALAMHEFGGHCIGRLTDEYKNGTYSSKTGYGENCQRSNTFMDSFMMQIRNAGDYNIATPERLAAGDSTGVGYFKCGSTSYYRASYVDVMCDNRAYINPWSRYLISKRIHENAGESYSISQFISEVPHKVVDPTSRFNRTRSWGNEFEDSPVGATPVSVKDCPWLYESE